MNTRPKKRAAFTLTELLLVISIIGILTALGLAVLRGAEDDALKSRTQAQIQRIAKELNKKLEQYTYRILPIRYSSTVDEVRIVNAASLEEILRVEMPSRRNDLLDDPVGNIADPPRFPVPPPPGPYPNSFPTNLAGGGIYPGDPTGYPWSDFPEPQLLLRYRAKLGMPTDGSNFGSWSRQFEGAECLYAILSLMYLDDGRAGLSILRKSEIADIDGDGNPEVVDAYGDPLEFDLYNVALASANGNSADPFAPLDPTTAIDPHINPRFNPAGNELPSPAQEYRIFIQSTNTKNALD